MSQETTPYDAAISDLENRIQYFQTMLDGMKQLRSQITGAPIPPSANGSRAPNDTEIFHDSFFGMTIGDGAKKYLNMVKATKSTADIATNLERGGLKHSSKNFNTTVRSVLGGRDDFLRVNGDWGLTEWYPNMRKDKKSKPPKAEPQTLIISNKPNEQKHNDEGDKAAKPTARDAILQLFGPGDELTVDQIEHATGLKHNTLTTNLSNLARTGALRRSGVGKYARSEAA
jgi:hypothetical protein